MLLKSCGTVYRSDALWSIRYGQTHMNEQLTKLACSLSFPIEANCQNHEPVSRSTIKYVVTYQEFSIRIRLACSQTSNLICIFLARWILLHSDMNKQRLSRQSSMKELFDETQENGQEKIQLQIQTGRADVGTNRIHRVTLHLSLLCSTTSSSTNLHLIQTFCVRHFSAIVSVFAS